ncbi:MAG: leucyl/phenylalanyl-tRNA--protein transferase [Gammaproteobacteria bacterium]
MDNLQWLDPFDMHYHFPDVSEALTEPDGLLAAGGDLSAERIMKAYRCGIFPWYSDGQPILWWSPDPRLVLYPEKLKISRSLRKRLRQQEFSITINRSFTEVIEACSQSRDADSGTWITEDMKQAYIHLHQLGHAHSVEAWKDGKLVGGLYGIASGQVFFGESMFTRETDASKVAFAHFVQWLQQRDFKLIDCQVESAHLISLGAENISREAFVKKLSSLCDVQKNAGQLNDFSGKEIK